MSEHLPSALIDGGVPGVTSMMAAHAGACPNVINNAIALRRAFPAPFHRAPRTPRQGDQPLIVRGETREKSVRLAPAQRISHAGLENGQPCFIKCLAYLRVEGDDWC